MSAKENTLKAGRPSVRNNKTATLASIADVPTMKRVNFDLSIEEHTKLKVYAARQGKTVKELLTEYVAQIKE